MIDVKLIVSDLDGTLLSSDKTLSRENLEAIEKIAKKGVEVAVSTGRAYSVIPDSIKENPHIRYVCHSNGAVIFDKRLGKNIVENIIDETSKQKILEILSEYDTLLCLHSADVAYFDEKSVSGDVFKKHQVNSSYERVFRKMQMTPDIKKLITESEKAELFIVFFADDSELAECKERLYALDGITLTSSIEHNIEICSGKAGKDKALRALLEILKISAENVIALGDSTNDLEMLEIAGLSVCTANGGEKAKAKASVTGPSNDGHIMKFVLENFL